MGKSSESKWKHAGVRVVHANELDVNTPQTSGMNRAAAITAARAGAEKLWAGTVVIHRGLAQFLSSPPGMPPIATGEAAPRLVAGAMAAMRQA